MISKEEIITTINSKRKLLQKFGVKQIGLFGSYSKNLQTENSDIDILIDFEKGQEKFDNLINTYDLLEKLFQNKKIEIVTRNGLSHHFKKNILKDIIYV